MLSNIINQIQSEREQDRAISIQTGTNRRHDLTNIRGHRKVGQTSFFSMKPIPKTAPVRLLRSASSLRAIVPEPVQEQPVEEQPVQEQPEEQPVQEQPVQEQPVQEQPVQEQPVQEQPVEEQPVEEQPVEEQPVEEQPEEPAPIEIESTVSE